MEIGQVHNKTKQKGLVDIIKTFVDGRGINLNISTTHTGKIETDITLSGTCLEFLEHPKKREYGDTVSYAVVSSPREE